MELQLYYRSLSLSVRVNQCCKPHRDCELEQRDYKLENSRHKNLGDANPNTSVCDGTGRQIRTNI